MLALEVCIKGSRYLERRKRHIGCFSLFSLPKLKKLLSDLVEGLLIH